MQKSDKNSADIDTNTQADDEEITREEQAESVPEAVTEPEKNNLKKRQNTTEQLEINSVQLQEKKQAAFNSAEDRMLQKAFKLMQKSTENSNKDKLHSYSIYGVHIAN